MIYGDLKPDNIMIQSNMGVKLMDFGSVMWGEDTNFVLGTVGYAAPEQLESESLFEVDERSDIYAVGAVFYEMLTGNKWNGRYMKNPFIAENVRRMIFKCTRLNPNERYQSISEVLDELRQVEKKDIVKDFFRIKKKPFLLEDKERTILVDWKGQIDSAPDKKE